MYRITKAWSFAAAHHLPSLPDGHKCRRVHGHNYRVTLTLESMRLDAHGMVVDYGDLAPFGNIIASLLDHRDLNGVLTNPTAEVLAAWLYEQALTLWPGLVTECTVSETDGTTATYRAACICAVTSPENPHPNIDCPLR